MLVRGRWGEGGGVGGVLVRGGVGSCGKGG